MTYFSRFAVAAAAFLFSVLALVSFRANASAIDWRVAVGFAPFQGLVGADGPGPEQTSDFWLPRYSQATGAESFVDWYARIVLTAGGSPQSPFAPYASGKLIGPWIKKGAENLTHGLEDWKLTCGTECYRPAYVHPKKAEVIARITDPALAGSCEWREQASGRVLATAPCDTVVRFAAPLHQEGSRNTAEHFVCVMSTSGARACESISPHQLVIVGLGDSFSAGEGNPDIPTRWPAKNVARSSYSWLRDYSAPAQWFDDRCHRSFWNNQTYQAMAMASADHHRLVTFLNYSCSGAAIYDGMLVPQWNTPGQGGGCSNINELYKAARCRIAHSQVRQAVADLCEAKVISDSDDLDALQQQALKDASAMNRRVAGSVHLMESFKFYNAHDPTWRHTGSDVTEEMDHLDIGTCPEDRFLKPNIVLLSMGGNDIGFGPLIRWALIPTEGTGKWGGVEAIILLEGVRRASAVCPAALGHDQFGCALYDDTLINDLPGRYSTLMAAFRTVLHVPPDAVFVTGYPDPLRLHAPDPIEFCDDEGNNSVHHNNDWDAIHALLPHSVLAGAGKIVRIPIDSNNLPLNITGRQAGYVYNSTLVNLRRALESIAATERFHLAATAADAFVGHAYCASPPPPGRELERWLPSTAGLAWGADKCDHNPACWKPYTPMARFVRTANDSFLTEASRRGDAIAGLMHPTAQGQAAIADTLASLIDARPHDGADSGSFAVHAAAETGSIANVEDSAREPRSQRSSQ